MNDISKSMQLREHVRMLERKLGVLDGSSIGCCTVTLAQCQALVEIGRANRISLSKLAKLLNLEISTMSRTVDNLVKRALVERKQDSKDRRYIAIELTSSGKELFEQIEMTMKDYFKNIINAIPITKQTQVLESIELLVNAIDIVEGNDSRS